MRRSLTSVVLATTLAAIGAAAQAASGEFAFVVGEVSLTKAQGQRSTPVKGTALDPGDVIATGANGMAQLTMVDQARLSLRPNTQFVIERYPDRRDSGEGAVLSLLKGTLRTFTGLIASTSRERYVMKTRVATVGIRGSGNILYACEGSECDPSVVGEGRSAGEPITVNHTIEGSHSITNAPADAVPGTPPRQGAAATLITGPGQTVMVQGIQPPRFIPTPQFIANVAVTMAGTSRKAEGAATTGAPPRDFAPSDTVALPATLQSSTPVIGNNGLGFPIVDASGNLGADPLGLRDVIVAIGSPFLTQATAAQLDLQGGFRGYTAYAGTQTGVSAFVGGGTLRDARDVSLTGGDSISMGRWEGASFGFFGPDSAAPISGSVHWIIAPSGYPAYFSDVLTGSATYTLAGATSPTNQDNVVGSLGSASLTANFTNRTLSLGLAVSVPAAGANPGGQWQMSAEGVPIASNTFFASSADHLTIVNGSGQSSRTNSLLGGSIEGSFVGRSLSGAILGYGISDQTSALSTHWNVVTGVAAFTGPAQDSSAPYSEGRISDPAGTLSDFIRTYATTDRPDEVVSDTQGRVTAFSAPFATLGSHASYTIGTAQVVQSGADPETGLIWGRWGGGIAQVAAGGQTRAIDLSNASLHYIFAGAQSGPVSLPLTGTGIYDVIGSTSPTDGAGHVGALNTAALNVNFTSRQLDASLNLAINNQTWTADARNVAIYRDQSFSAYSGTPIPGLPNPAPLIIGCSPGCGQGATGSIDGFFSGRTGQRAGMMYNLGGVQGVIAFGRRGG